VAAALNRFHFGVSTSSRRPCCGAVPRALRFRRTEDCAHYNVMVTHDLS